MANSNHINNVAIVGANGNCGSFMTEALLKTGKHTITALTRAGKQNTFPDGVSVRKVDYERPETVVEALRGQDALVITMAGTVPQELQLMLVKAAGEASVPWIMPNEWSPDSANEALLDDVFLFKPKAAVRKTIEDLGKSSYIALSTGFWYEMSLSIPVCYGIDLVNHTATLFDDGETKVSASTWPQVGRAVAAILSLPIQPEGGNKEACLSSLRNRVVYTSSFTLSQRDMLASAQRVTGTQESDWRVRKEPAQERWAAGMKNIGAGRENVLKLMYSRVFYADGSGDVESSKGTLNKMLGLPQEDLDEATRVAVERAKLPGQ